MEKGTFKAVIAATDIGASMYLVRDREHEYDNDWLKAKVVAWAFDENGLGFPVILNPYCGVLETIDVNGEGNDEDGCHWIVEGQTIHPVDSELPIGKDCNAKRRIKASPRESRLADAPPEHETRLRGRSGLQ